jgi:hypothetical protein
MDSGGKFLVIASVIICAAILQILLVVAEDTNTPAKAAVSFAKAYFKLDRSMADYLCEELSADTGAVEAYINRVADKAKMTGFKLNYMTHSLSHIETKTEMEGDGRAQVRITCSRSRYLNPVFAAVAKVFFLTETQKVDETISLVKEGDQWKVCGRPFALVEI